MPTENSDIQVNDFSFKSQHHTLLHCPDFKFYQGCTLLTGASGIGKSTLFVP